MFLRRSRLPFSPIVAAAALLAAGEARGQTQTTTLNYSSITKDAFVTPGPDGSRGVNNYGGTGALSVAAPGSPQGQFDSLMTFDTSSATALFNTQMGVDQWDVLNLSLKVMNLTNNNPSFFNNSTPGTLNVYWAPNAGGFVEGSGSPMMPGGTGVTFNTLPGLTAGEQLVGTLDFAMTATGVQQSIDLMLHAGMVGEIKAGLPLTFHLGATDGGALMFGSRSNPVIINRPEFELTAGPTAVPEPSSLASAAIAAAGGAYVRRRRRRKKPAILVEGDGTCSLSN